MFLLLGVCFRLINFVSSNVSLNLDTQCRYSVSLEEDSEFVNFLRRSLS